MNRHAGIEVRALRWHPADAPGRDVIAGASFRVLRGSCIALTGGNGAGKTTLLRVLAALLRPTGGSVHVHGHPVNGGSHRVRRVVGLLPGGDAVPDRTTPIAHIRFHALLRGFDWREATRRAGVTLAAIGLEHLATDRVGMLSAGMRRRVALARALVHDPPVLLLDEPDAHLDPRAAAMVGALIRQRRDAGTTILLVTHRLSWARGVCDRICEMQRGVVRELES